MLPALLWYLAATLIGLLAFPLAHRMLPALPGRGYAFARALGVLLWGFIFWLLSSLGVLANDLGGLYFALLVLVALGLWALRRSGLSALLEWFRDNRGLVIAVEAVFLAAFAFMVFVRASNPEVAFTEQPMELAFISASLRSPAMPPHDPWLSGYAISYYYFGYVQTAMMAKLTGVTAGVAFNLQIALVFALTAVGAFGVVYDLLAVYRPKFNGNSLLALFAPLYVLLVSNAEGFLELLHDRGLFWSSSGSGELTSRFWAWLDIRDLTTPPTLPFDPERDPRYLWWWRASRIITDYDWAGVSKGDVISEFPVFSFILSDLHPHVLVLPFALLGIALALNLFLGGAQGRIRLYPFQFEIAPSSFLFAAIVIGGLPFLNIWEFPLYVGLFAAAYVFRRAGQVGWGWSRLSEFLALGFSLGVAAALAYLPYYVGFDSQAGGILPNLLYPTRGAHLWVMWVPFWLPLVTYLAYLWRKQGQGHRLLKGLLVTLLFVGALLLVAFLLTLFIMRGLPNLGGLNPLFGLARDAFLGSIGAPHEPGFAPTEWDLIREALHRRTVSTGGWITLAFMLTLTVGLLWPRKDAPESEEGVEVTSQETSPSHTFVLLLVLFGMLLVFVPEFIYLRDVFGYRINTIFKFYYQAWLLFGLAAAFGTAVLLTRLRRAAFGFFAAGLVLVLVVGMTYTVFGFDHITNGFQPEDGFKLDGADNNIYLTSDDATAVAWLRKAPLGTLVEAVGGSYSGYARISVYSGQPALLGWPGHESQWRGGYEEMGSRQNDIAAIYTSPDWEQTRSIIERYDIRYIYVGPLERSTYQVNDRKFNQFLTPVFQSGAVTIYAVP